MFTSSVFGKKTQVMFSLLPNIQPLLKQHMKGGHGYMSLQGLGHEAKGSSQWIQCPYADGARDRHGTQSNGDAYQLADGSSEFLKYCVS